MVMDGTLWNGTLETPSSFNRLFKVSFVDTDMPWVIEITLEEVKVPFIQQSQYHSYWWSGNPSR